MKYHLLFTNFNTSILGVIMLIVGFSVLVFGLFKWMLFSVIMSLGGIFLIAMDMEKRR